MHFDNITVICDLNYNVNAPQSNRFLSNRGFLKDPVIILSENNNIISDQTSVSNILNNFFL